MALNSRVNAAIPRAQIARAAPGRAIGVDAALRRRGLGRRLIEIIELEPLTLGCHSIVLGAAEDARGFYDRLGYRGKHAMRQKELPRPGWMTALRVRKMRA